MVPTPFSPLVKTVERLTSTRPLPQSGPSLFILAKGPRMEVETGDVDALGRVECGVGVKDVKFVLHIPTRVVQLEADPR